MDDGTVEVSTLPGVDSYTGPLPFYKPGRKRADLAMSSGEKNFNPTYEFYVGGSSWVPFPRNFFDFLRDNNLKNSEICIAVFLWQYAYRNDLIGEFSLSTSKIAQEASCSKRQAVYALATLKRIGALILAKRGRSKNAAENIWRWNVETLKASAKNAQVHMQEMHKPYAESAQDHVQNLHYIYIESFIKNLISSLKGSRHVDNSQPELLGDDKAAPVGASSPDEMLAAWMAAIKRLAPAHGFNHVYLILKCHRPLDLNYIHSPYEFLRSRLNDASVIYDLKKNNPSDFFETDSLWLQFMEFCANLKNENHLEGGENHV